MEQDLDTLHLEALLLNERRNSRKWEAIARLLHIGSCMLVERLRESEPDLPAPPELPDRI